MGERRYARFAIFLAFVVGGNVAAGQSLGLFAGSISIEPNDTVTCDSQMTCIEGECNRARWCIQKDGRWVQYGILTCDDTTDERYCNAGVCSTRPLARCDTLSTDFICPLVDGMYPDPDSCTRYHICVSGVRRTNDCPLNNVYDHQLGRCKYRRFASDCVVFRCSNRDGQAIVYPRDDRIYGRCLSGKAIILGRCQEHERYNLAAEKCERFCRSAGNQPPDPGRCGKFIQCAETLPGRFEPSELVCGCDQGYDETEKRCSVSAPCVRDTPKIWCKPPDTTESGEQTTASTTEAAAEVPASLNRDNNVADDQGSKSVQRRSMIPFMNRYPMYRQNGYRPDSDNVPPTLTSDVLGHGNEDAANGGDAADEGLIGGDNNDNADKPGIKIEEHFLRFIIQWIMRMVSGAPAA